MGVLKFHMQNRRNKIFENNCLIAWLRIHTLKTVKYMRKCIVMVLLTITCLTAGYGAHNALQPHTNTDLCMVQSIDHDHGVIYFRDANGFTHAYSSTDCGDIYAGEYYNVTHDGIYNIYNIKYQRVDMLQ